MANLIEQGAIQLADEVIEGKTYAVFHEPDAVIENLCQTVCAFKGNVACHNIKCSMTERTDRKNVIFQEKVKVCKTLGPTCRGCPDCGAVMGDATYAQMFKE